MYRREISLPVKDREPYRRPTPDYHAPQPVRRRRRRRKTCRRPLQFLTVFCAILVLSVLLAASFTPSPEDTGTALPQTAPVVSVQSEEPSFGTVSGDWRLTLVNPWNPLPSEYTFTKTELSNGHAVDKRCYPELQDMMDACRDAGFSPLICSSYRSYEKQEELFQNKIERLKAQGYSAEEAETEAGKEVAVPGTSEHQLGLALDIVDAGNQNLDRSQENTGVQQWLMAHSWEYGFILRYPNDKSEITGIIYEPWHYRYVGKDAAKDIYGQGLCLEEYLDTVQ